MFPKGRRTSGGWSLQFLCFDSLLFFSGPLRVYFPSRSSAPGLGGTLYLCWVFPQAPCTSSPVAFRRPWAAPWGELVAAVCPLPSEAGFDQGFRGWGGGRGLCAA